MTILISPDDPHDPQATALLQASHALMQDLFSPEDNHFLSIDDLCSAEIRFFTAREGDTMLGCAALANKRDYGEVKSMFVSPDARGKGVAALLLDQVEADARHQGLSNLRLETGDKLEDAHRLYYRHGFTLCDPFGAYEASESSVFMEKSLT